MFGRIVMTWLKLLGTPERISTNLSLGKWSSLLGGIFGKSEMTELSGTFDLLSGVGGMTSFMIYHYFPIESKGNIEMPCLSGLISYLLKEGFFV